MVEAAQHIKLEHGIIVPLASTMVQQIQLIVQELSLPSPRASTAKEQIVLRLVLDNAKPLVSREAWELVQKRLDSSPAVADSLFGVSTASIAARLELDVTSIPKQSETSPSRPSPLDVTHSRKRQLPYIKTNSFWAPLESNEIVGSPLSSAHAQVRWQSTSGLVSNASHSSNTTSKKLQTSRPVSISSLSACSTTPSSAFALESPLDRMVHVAKHRPLSLLVAQNQRGADTREPSSPTLQTKHEWNRNVTSFQDGVKSACTSSSPKEDRPSHSATPVTEESPLSSTLPKFDNIKIQRDCPRTRPTASCTRREATASLPPRFKIDIGCSCYPYLSVYPPRYPEFDLYPGKAAEAIQLPTRDSDLPPLVLLRKPTIKRPSRLSLSCSVRATTRLVGADPSETYSTTHNQSARTNVVGTQMTTLDPNVTTLTPSPTLDHTRPTSEWLGHLLPSFPDIPTPCLSMTSNSATSSILTSPALIPSPTLNAARINAFASSSTSTLIEGDNFESSPVSAYDRLSENDESLVATEFDQTDFIHSQDYLSFAAQQQLHQPFNMVHDDFHTIERGGRLGKRLTSTFSDEDEEDDETEYTSNANGTTMTTTIGYEDNVSQTVSSWRDELENVYEQVEDDEDDTCSSNEHDATGDWIESSDASFFAEDQSCQTFDHLTLDVTDDGSRQVLSEIRSV
ncbi:hypothetical protein OIO90_001627 [Microbotryomycetes sp. JL221]|nr:hypothetical protein OIO90_001627 [Microbotryomycetes sp. JL221]